MRAWWAARSPTVKGFVGAVAGVVTIAVVVHVALLYLALIRIINFLAVYGEKIQKLP